MTTAWSAARGELGGVIYNEVTSSATSADAPLVIGLHGRGGNAEELVGHARTLHPGWRYLFVQAPHRLDTGPGQANFSWYEPIMSADERQNGPERGIPVSPQLLVARERMRRFLRIAHERLGVPPTRSALFGFSQGAAMTLDTGLRADPPYRALVAICGYLPEGDAVTLQNGAARQQPLLVISGTADDPLRLGMGRRANRVLEAAGLAPEYHEVPMAHEIGAAALDTIATFLRRHLDSA